MTIRTAGCGLLTLATMLCWADDARAAPAGGRPAAQASNAQTVAAEDAWRQGRMADAIAAADAAVAASPGVASWTMRARLADAEGQPATAAALYAKAAAASSGPTAATLRLRAAIATALAARSPDALLVLAGNADAATRNGIADMLGVLGYPARALTLYQPSLQGASAYGDAVLMAQWAIAAGDRTAGSDQSWRAYRIARTTDDKRYALALLAESFRNARDLPELLAFLDSRPDDDAVRQMRADTLVDMERFDDAVALIRSDRGALREQLPNLLDVMGRRDALIAEYRAGIARDPQALQRYEALATLYLAAGDEPRAIEVYRGYFAANAGARDRLLDAARRMIAMGMTEPALALVRQSVGTAAGSSDIRFFQFETDLGQGRTTAALAVLADLDRDLPASDPRRGQLAESYERLGRGDRALRVLEAQERAGRSFGYDDQVHMAQLAADEGRAEAALARLLALSKTTTLPARRSFLEGQIVDLADRLGRIDALSAESCARLATTAGPDLSLLVALRLKAGDEAGARAAIEQFARTSRLPPVERLERQGNMYARLKDYAGYRDVLARLVSADPANAGRYLQQMTQEAVRHPLPGQSSAERQRVVSDLIARLARTGRGDLPGQRRFAAAVYALADMPDRAIDAYRAAIAATPDDEEAVQALATLLNATGRRAEAVGMLQYRAEFASSTSAMAAALDALSAVLSAAPAQAAQGTSSARYARDRTLWSERLVLARIARSGKDPLLYDLLASTGENSGDLGLQIRAREMTLTLPGRTQASALRQLIALVSAANASDGTAGPAVGNNDRKVAYGRRLVALRRPYPADVYADIARALLAQRQMAGAQLAFGLIDDIPGLVNVEGLKGDAYLSAGYRQAALASYTRGLLRARDDSGLQLKVAILQEEIGDRRVAADLYWRALHQILMRTALLRPADQLTAPWQPAALDATMLEGLLLNWPTDAAERQRIASAVATIVADGIAGLPGTGREDSNGWRSQARLPLALELARRVADAGGGTAMLDAVEGRLDAVFGGDPVYRQDRALFRDLTGQPRSIAVTADADASDWITGGLVTVARDDGDFDLRMAVALAAGDGVAIRTLLQAALTKEVAFFRDKAAVLPTYQSDLNTGLILAAARLSPDMVRQIVVPLLDGSGFAERILFNLLRSAPDRLALLERSAGRTLLPRDRAAALLATAANDPVPMRLSLRRRGGTPYNALTAMFALFSVDERIALYRAFAASTGPGGGASGLMSPLLELLLRQPLDATQQATLLPALRAAMATQPATTTAGQLLVLDAPAANRPLSIAAADALAADAPAEAVVPAALRAYYAGDQATTLELLTRRVEQQPAEIREPAWPIRIIGRYLADARRKAAEAFLALPQPTGDEQARFYARYVASGPLTNLEDTPPRRYVERLVALDPGNLTYAVTLMQRLWNDGDRPAFARMLQTYVDGHRDDREAASVLALAYLLLRQPDAAAAVRTQTGVDIADPDWFIDMLNLANAAGSGREGDFRSLFGLVASAARDEAPTLPVLVEVAKRQAVDQVTAAAPPADPFDAVVAAAAADPATAPSVMRGVWRRSLPSEGAPGEGDTRAALLEGLPRPTPKPAQDTPDARLLATLTGTAAMGQELDRELSALPPARREMTPILYDVVAQGEIDRGTAPARIDALLATLATGPLSAHDLQMLATLLARTGTALSPANLSHLAVALRDMPRMSAGRRIQWSLIFARAGDDAGARRWLAAAAMQILYPDTSSLGMGSALATFDDIVAALRSWPDRAAALAAYAELSKRIDAERAAMPPDDVPGPLPTFDPAPPPVAVAR